MLFMCYVANVVQCDNHNTDTDVYIQTQGYRWCSWVSNHFQRAIIGRLELQAEKSYICPLQVERYKQQHLSRSKVSCTAVFFDYVVT